MEDQTDCGFFPRPVLKKPGPSLTIFPGVGQETISPLQVWTTTSTPVAATPTITTTPVGASLLSAGAVAPGGRATTIPFRASATTASRSRYPATFSSPPGHLNTRSLATQLPSARSSSSSLLVKTERPQPPAPPTSWTAAAASAPPPSWTADTLDALFVHRPDFFLKIFARLQGLVFTMLAQIEDFDREQKVWELAMLSNNWKNRPVLKTLQSTSASIVPLRFFLALTVVCLSPEGGGGAGDHVVEDAAAEQGWSSAEQTSCIGELIMLCTFVVVHC